MLWYICNYIYNSLQIYPLQQFMNAAQINITLFLPLVITFTAELFVSIGRVEEFLSLGK